jgi:hypothetical protein
VGKRLGNNNNINSKYMVTTSILENTIMVSFCTLAEEKKLHKLFCRHRVFQSLLPGQGKNFRYAEGQRSFELGKKETNLHYYLLLFVIYFYLYLENNAVLLFPRSRIQFKYEARLAPTQKNFLNYLGFDPIALPHNGI